MPEPMSDERLAQIRACPEPPFDNAATRIVYDTIQELLKEVDRLREAEAELTALRDQLGEMKTEWGARWRDSGGGETYTPIFDSHREAIAAYGRKAKHLQRLVGEWRPVEVDQRPAWQRWGNADGGT